MGDATPPTLEETGDPTLFQDIDEEDLADVPHPVGRIRWEDDSSDDQPECAPPLDLEGI
jgi:hypothetical protein